MNNKMWKIMQLGVTGNASVTASRVFQFSIVQKDKKPKLTTYLRISLLNLSTFQLLMVQYLQSDCLLINDNVRVLGGWGQTKIGDIRWCLVCCVSFKYLFCTIDTTHADNSITMTYLVQARQDQSVIQSQMGSDPQHYHLELSVSVGEKIKEW